MSFQIVTDTSANLPSAWLRQEQIAVLPFSYSVDGKREENCLDTEKFKGKKFYQAIRDGARVTTSQITPQAYLDCFRPMLEHGEEILFVGMSSGISGSFQSAQIAAQELGEQFPDGKLELIDTLSASLGEGILVLRAAEDRRNGRTLEETAKHLSELRHRVCQIFTVDDLMYLRKGGRLSNVAAVVGTMLRIKPLLKGNELGKIVTFEKCRGRKRAIEAMVKFYAENVVDPLHQTVGIAHADCPEDAKTLARLLERKNRPGNLLTVCYEPVTGSHVGPSTLALFFEASEGIRSK